MPRADVRRERPGSPSGGVIEPELLLGGYASGCFPMADGREGEIQWYSPDPRGIIPLEGFAVSRSLQQTLQKRIFDVRINTAFETVMRHCAEREETWISEEIVQSYLRLHALGHAHSVETWRSGELVGGLYGVALGAAFFGESMFSAVRDSSKVALVALVARLKAKGFELLDTQFITPHLARFGAREISREAYLHLLAQAIRKRRSFTD
jgi:leucyl/phenylalanyl-tRNA--protein transferase